MMHSPVFNYKIIIILYQSKPKGGPRATDESTNICWKSTGVRTKKAGWKALLLSFFPLQYSLWSLRLCPKTTNLSLQYQAGLRNQGFPEFLLRISHPHCSSSLLTRILEQLPCKQGHSKCTFTVQYCTVELLGLATTFAF